jgi:hypothetical protein
MGNPLFFWGIADSYIGGHVVSYQTNEFPSKIGKFCEKFNYRYTSITAVPLSEGHPTAKVKYVGWGLLTGFRRSK